MSSPNFQSILDQPVTEINRPKPLPVGTYLCIVDGIPKFDKSKQKQTDYVEFSLKPVQAGPDVDQEALSAANGIGEKKLRLTFYLTEDSVYRLDVFLFEHLGIPMGTSRKEAIASAPGKQVNATVSHQASQDGQAIFANVTGTARV